MPIALPRFNRTFLNRPMFLSPMSASEHITDSSRTSREVRKVPLPDIADGYIGSSSTPENSKWPE